MGLASAFALLTCAAAAGDVDPRGASPPEAHETGAAHAAHRVPLEQKGYRRTEARYEVPDLTLIAMDGGSAALRDVLAADEPVLLQFIFTTCTTICPVLSASFSAVQDELGGASGGYQMVSITVDPEHDTPERLRAYAARWKADERWEFLTGPRARIEHVQKAFDAWYPANNKMYHRPYTFLRAAHGASWVRLDGLLSRADLVAEYRSLVEDDGHSTH